ncbi:MAG: DUF5688 family protein [Lachnospiraceae bacterium]|nr:DUF5688 family protein [Lachnospiraceae bacterium]
MKDEDLLDCAIENTKKLFQIDLEPVKSVLIELGETNENILKNAKGYVMRSSSDLSVQASLIFDNILNDVSKQVGGRFYLLVLSHNEVIIQPLEEGDKRESLFQVKAQLFLKLRQAEELESLSNNLYLYTPNEGLSVVAKVN